MAGNARFHNKWHRRNHHSSPSIGYPDSGTDPIASPEEPFIGDFVTYNSISAHENLFVDGNATVLGNLSVLGEFTYLDTVVSVTSALSVINHGTGPALTVVQYGKQPIAQFIDGDALSGGKEALFITDNGYVVVNGTTAAQKYDPYQGNLSAVSMDFNVYGNGYAKKAFIYDRPDGNTVYVSVTGSDYNSGLNPSQKVRTIKKACQIVFDVYGTNKATIQVEAGDYTEVNPIYVPAGTSIIGEAYLRRTTIRPYHKQMDIFWLNNACYLWGFTFRDTWDPCAATAFPNLDTRAAAYKVAFNTPGYEIDTTKPGGPFGLPIVSKPFITTSPYTQGMSSITNYLKVPIQPDLYPSYFIPFTQEFESFDEGDNVNKLFSIITTTLSTAVVPTPPAITAPGSFTSTAVNILTYSLSSITAAVIRYVDSNSPPYNYNKTKCARDTEYILNAVIDGLTTGTSTSAIDCANAYVVGGYVPLPEDQIEPTINAYNYARDLCLAAIQPGKQEQSNVELSFDIVADIVEGGAIPAPVTTTPSIGRDTAITLLQTNSAFIQEATVRWVSYNYPLLAYNRNSCFRDVGYIIEATVYDLLNNTTLSAISAGEYYKNGTSSVLPDDQIQQTADAIRFAKSVAVDVINNKYLRTYEQQFDTAYTNGYQATGYITDEFNTIISIIRNGTTTLPPVCSIPTNSDAAYLLNLNKPFVQKTTINYVDKTFPGFAYSRDICERDTGLIIDCIVSDLQTGTNVKAISAGSRYYKGSKSVIVGQEAQTIAALRYINFLANKLVTNTPAVTSQTFNPFLSSGYLIKSDVTKSFDTITDIIITGEKLQNQVFDPFAPTGNLASAFVEYSWNIVAQIIGSNGTYTPTATSSPTPVPGAADAITLLQSNKPYIQRLVVDYVDKIYPKLTYNNDLCYRDVGLIIDSIIQDITLNTNFYSISAGSAYFKYNQSLISGQESPTIAALLFANLVSQAVISNTPFKYYTQQYDPTYALGGDASPYVQTGYTVVSGIILNGIGSISPGTFTPPVPGSTDANYLLELNKTFIQNEVVNYVNTTYPTLKYNIASCLRDTGYIVEAVSYDITQGNYLSCINSGNYYYTGTGKSRVTGQQKQTADALNYANIISQNIITNSPIASRFDTVALLQANKLFIQKEVIEYLNKAYPTFVYNKDKCERDVGTIIDAVCYDVTNGTTASAIDSGNAYFNNLTNQSLISGQEIQTVMAINYAKYLALQIIANEPVKFIGAGCGIRVDGELATGFTRSFVTDSFTQYNQGGKGIHIINCGYAQLVSTFTICTSEGVICETGGNCSISTSNCSFGLSGLVATGKSTFPVLTGYQVITSPLAENYIYVQDVTPRPLSAFVAALQAGYELEGIPVLEPYNGLLINVEGDPASNYDAFFNPNTLAKYHSIKSVSALEAPYPPYSYRIELEQNIQAPLTASSNEPKYIEFYLRSQIASSSHAFEYIGTGIDLELAVPALGGKTNNNNEAVFSDNGIVYYSSTNERGDFKVGGGFKVVQGKGTIEGLDFNKSILALVTPLILSLD
jgi:hypothetical protein